MWPRILSAAAQSCASKLRPESLDLGLLSFGMCDCGWDSESFAPSTQWLSSFIENLEIFVVRVNAAVVASGGFAGDAEFGQVVHGRGHGRYAELQFVAGRGNHLELKVGGLSFNFEVPN